VYAFAYRRRNSQREVAAFAIAVLATADSDNAWRVVEDAAHRSDIQVPEFRQHPR
jgi:hypothetical protein